MRRTLIAVLAAAGCLAAAQAAAASTLVVQGGNTLQFTAAAAETNDVTVSRSATLFTVTDPGSTITATGPCASVNPNTATCPVAGVAAVALSLADRNDQAAIDASVSLVGVTIQGGDGNDTLTGGENTDDVLSGDSAAAGDDTLNSLGGDDRLTGGDGNDLLNGGEGSDSLSGDAGLDTIQGGAGDDTIFSGVLNDEPDAMGGGAGTDLVDYSGASAGVTVSLDGVANDGVPGEGDNVGVDVEDVTGTAKADAITGSAAANELLGGAGNDTLSGAGGSDGLDGGRGNDALDGGAGIDAIVGGPGNDALRGRDISADDVSCGGGADSAVLDALDVPRACETVSRGVGVATTFASVRGRAVTLRLVCPAIEGVRCIGTLTLRSGSARVGGRTFSIDSGTSVEVRVALTPRGRRARAVVASNVFRDALGVGVITRRTVTLR